MVSTVKMQERLGETWIDPRVLRTRQILQQAFNELMAEKDFHSITVQDITKRARVNRATFYAHFEDKYALLNHTVRESLEAMLARKLSDNHLLTLDKLHVLAVTVFEFLGQFFGRCIAITSDNAHLLIAAQVQQHLNDIIRDWVACTAKNTGKAFELPDDVSSVISWMIFGAAFEWARGDRKVSPESSAQQTLTFLAPSLKALLVNE